jgi:hypothetical protein
MKSELIKFGCNLNPARVKDVVENPKFVEVMASMQNDFYKCMLADGRRLRQLTELQFMGMNVSLTENSTSNLTLVLNQLSKTNNSIVSANLLIPNQVNATATNSPNTSTPSVGVRINVGTTIFIILFIVSIAPSA